MRYGIFGLLALFVAFSAGAAPTLSSNDQKEVDRAEAYLNAVTILRARFLQVAPDGSTAEGTLSLSRPGRLRLDYDPPTPMIILANGDWLVYHDSQLDHTSYVDIDSTPAALLVKKDLHLNTDGATVTGVAHKPGLVEITAVKEKDPRQGKITLVFSEAPYQLKQWLVTDAQGQTTTVSLYDPKTDVKFDPNIFRDRDPHVFEPLGNR
jgi:outer membrane lipoprotein-sorting protein